VGLIDPAYLNQQQLPMQGNGITTSAEGRRVPLPLLDPRQPGLRRSGADFEERLRDGTGDMRPGFRVYMFKFTVSKLKGLGIT
jgi:hypothetical protein